MASTTHDHAHEHDDGAVHVHVHSIRLYVTIFLTLLALTIITVLTSYLDIDGTIRPGTPHGAGGFNFALAMVIATIKAGCVVTWFMHLKDDKRFNAMVFVGSVLFAAIFFAYTHNDLGHRGDGDRFHGIHVIPSTGERAPGGVTSQFLGEEPLPGIERTIEAEHPSEGGEHGEPAAVDGHGEGH